MNKGPRKKNLILLSLLALVCVAAVELIVCRYYDPALYHTVTDPVVTAVTGTASAISDAASDAAAGLKGWIDTAIEEARARSEAKRAAEALAQAQQDAMKHSLQNEDAYTPLYADDQTASQPLIETSVLKCDPAVTELQMIDGWDTLTGGMVNVVYFSQSDPVWGSLKYGSDQISTHGCGPVSMAMVVSSLTDTVTDPGAMAEWAVRNGYWARGSGSYHSIVMGTAAGFGLSAESFPSRDITTLQDALLSGKLLVALMGPGHFTRSGHFIVLRGVTLNGEILIADPSSPDRSLMAWDAQIILDELSLSTSDGGPLWVISAPNQLVSE